MSFLFQKYKSILGENGILPVICLKSQAELNTFTDAILQTPLRCVEITLRHPFCPTAISYIKKNYPEITVGAGTVVSSEILNTAIECGADFCVSPGLDEKLLCEAQTKNIALLPGCSSPTEILKAALNGLDTVKFFPAEISGGIKALNLYKGAFPDISFLPTGGITTDNFLKYLSLKNVLACGGSFMIPNEMLNLQDSEGIFKTIMKCISGARELRK